MDRLSKAIVRFYNRMRETEIEDISEVSAEDHEFLLSFTYAELCKPFIIEDIKNGLSREQLSIKYELHVAVIRRIGYNAMLYSCA